MEEGKEKSFNELYDEEYNREWREEYKKRVNDIDKAEVRFEKTKLTATLKIRGPAEFIETLGFFPSRAGEVLHLIISNYNITKTTFKYDGRVKPYSVPSGINTLKNYVEKSK
jgi:hypothetical protein